MMRSLAESMGLSRSKERRELSSVCCGYSFRRRAEAMRQALRHKTVMVAGTRTMVAL